MPQAAPHYSPAADPRFTEAMRLHVEGKLEDARMRYIAILQDAPGAADVHHALGAIYLQQQNADASLSHFGKAHAAAPANARYATHLAHAQKSAGKPEDAAATWFTLARAHPNDQKIFTDFFNACVEMQCFAPVAEHARQLLKTRPEDAMLHSILPFLYDRLGQHARKLPHLAFTYRKNPAQSPEFLVDYIKCLRIAQQLEEAEAVTDAGLRQHIYSQELYALKAGALHMRGLFKEALDGYERALLLNPASGQIHASIGILKMMLTDFAEGYEEYSFRPNLDSAMTRLAGYYPKWEGEPIQGKKLMLWTEQGIGDIVMFLTLLPWLLERGPNITCVVMGKLIPLLERSFPEVKFVANLHVAEVDNASAKAFDYHLPLGELMQRALPHYTPSEHAPCLVADAEKVGALRARYEAIAKERGAKKLVGISWHTKNDDTSYLRNIPLAQWEALFALPNVQYVSLQYGDHAEEIAAVNARFPRALLVDAEVNAFDDVDALAAQTAAMDEVISIQNAAVHLAGALGVPVTILLNASSDWRWGLKAANRWYKSVTIARQEKLLEWKPLLEQMAAQLGKH